MLTVFRIQDADGRGPFKPGFSSCWSVPRLDQRNLPPWYTELGAVHLLALPGEHIGCGCRTIVQLRRWFIPSEYATLLTHGYKAVQLFDVRILGSSDTQCLFARTKPLAEGAMTFELY